MFERSEQNTTTFFIDNGDDCEGTGLSDAKYPRCSEIYNML